MKVFEEPVLLVETIVEEEILMLSDDPFADDYFDDDWS